MTNRPVAIGIMLVLIATIILVPLSGPLKIGVVLCAVFLASLYGMRR